MEISVDFIVRLFVAGLLGVVIGLEREYRAKEAGYRTHFLVSLGSALLMIVSQYGFNEVLGESGVGLDPSRIAAQVVTGIGFIGAGTIIINKQIVRGLTTAAGIWATSAIGLAVGAGMYWLALFATLLTLAGLELLSFLFRSVGLRSYSVEFTVHGKATLDTIIKRFSSKDYVVVSYAMEEKNLVDSVEYNVSITLKLKYNGNESSLFELFNEFDDAVVHKIE